MGPLTCSLLRDWEELAALDPFWANLSDKEKQFDGWGRDEFFATGAAEIADLMRVSAEIGYPAQHQRALDFGCGVGRLTRALRDHFACCIGVDISAGMVASARRLTPECQFEVLGKTQLQLFPTDHFDLIYSNIVLQHQRTTAEVRAYIMEFLRILRPGGLLAFQLPHFIPLRYRLQPRRRAYHALRAIGLRPRVLYNRLHLNPIGMIAMHESKVTQLVNAAGGRVLRIRCDQNGGPHVESRTYFVTVTS